MVRIVLAAILGGLLMFVWSAFAHMVLPFERAALKPIPNEPAVLSALGVNLLRTIARGEASFLFRTVVTEAARSPEFGDLFYARGPGLTVERLTQYLAEACARGAPVATPST